MTLQEQAWQSGLVLLDEKWNETDLPPLEGGWRFNHASVVLNHPDQDGNDNKDNAQTVVVVGGVNKDWRSTNSVLVLNLAESNQQWREGPPLNKRRRGPAAVVCNGGVYVMGGGNGPSNWNCIERIDASGLLQSASTLNSSQQKIHWVTLNSPLSTGRIACAAVAVHNRYIVVVGGWSVQEVSVFSSVDIIDTNSHIVTAGPSMNFPRINFASAVIGHRILVAGCSTRVEYLDYANHCDNDEQRRRLHLQSFPSRPLGPLILTWCFLTHEMIVEQLPWDPVSLWREEKTIQPWKSWIRTETVFGISHHSHPLAETAV